MFWGLGLLLFGLCFVVACVCFRCVVVWVSMLYGCCWFWRCVDALWGLVCIVRAVFCGFGSVVACVACMLIECCFCGFGDV